MNDTVEEKIKACFGENAVLKTTTRLLGGAQKHTWLAALENGFSFVIYKWDKSTNYFTDSQHETDEKFQSSSPRLFVLNNRMMREHGVRTPKLYYMDDMEKEPVYAFVEYIDGVDMDFIMEKQPERLPNVLYSLKESLNKLHTIKESHAGQLGNLLSTDYNPVEESESVAAKNILYLKKAAPENRELYDKLTERIQELKVHIKQCKKFCFIHSELGPNHVMVDSDDNAYVIDIEGARFFELEFEESFLKIRFGEAYEKLKTSGLDEERMQFYQICHCVGSLSGAYELLEKDYYDKEDLYKMITFLNQIIKNIVDIRW